MFAFAGLPRWTTNDEALMAKFVGFDVHGGPPLAYVPAGLSPGGKAYYLGIMHHFEKWVQSYCYVV